MLKTLIRKEKAMNESKRFKNTLAFIQNSPDPPKKILDMGTPNRLGEFLKNNGFEVENTSGEDLDVHPEVLKVEGFDAITGFEILEHLINPMGVLKEIKANQIFLSIPLDLWFSKAYRNKKDPWDRHFHEFEDWQFDWLLDKSGWEITRRDKWTCPGLRPGFRPILRWFYPRYYIVEAKRKNGSIS